MVRLLVLLLCSFLLVTQGIFASPEHYNILGYVMGHPTEAIKARDLAATVVIYGLSPTDPHERVSAGVGVIVSREGSDPATAQYIIATAGHVSSMDRLEVFTSTGEQLKVTGHMDGLREDIGVIFVSGSKVLYNPVLISTVHYEKEPAFVLGAHDIKIDDDPKKVLKISPAAVMTNADINTLDPNDNNTSKVIAYCPQCYSGDSGGGLFNEQGALLGILNIGFTVKDIEDPGPDTGWPRNDGILFQSSLALEKFLGDVRDSKGWGYTYAIYAGFDLMVVSKEEYELAQQKQACVIVVHTPLVRAKLIGNICGMSF